MKDLTTEQYRLIYDQPIYPKNLYLDRAPYTHEEYREQVLEPNIERLRSAGLRGAGRGRETAAIREGSEGAGNEIAHARFRSPPLDPPLNAAVQSGGAQRFRR